MQNYKEIAKLFEENSKEIDFFQNSNISSIAKDLKTVFDNDVKQLLFLIGEPGVGKSAFLNNFENIFGESYKYIKFDMPFFEPVDFVKTLIDKRGVEVESYSLEKLVKQVTQLYKEDNYIILIDEAQLLTKEMIELIRILADSKSFWFLLAMHKHESKKILDEPQFASRPHKVLELGKLKKEEYKEYIYNELLKVKKPHFAEELSKKYLSMLYKFSDGNFRDLKKLLFYLFVLLQHAQEQNKPKYQKLSKCLVTMAAIEGGLIDV